MSVCIVIRAENIIKDDGERAVTMLSEIYERLGRHVENWWGVFKSRVTWTYEEYDSNGKQSVTYRVMTDGTFVIQAELTFPHGREQIWVIEAGTDFAQAAMVAFCESHRESCRSVNLYINPESDTNDFGKVLEMALNLRELFV